MDYRATERQRGGAAVEAQVTIGSEKLVWEFGTLVVGKNSLVVFEDLRVANIDCIGMP